MRVAITGGTGTLGRALIPRLLKDGAERVVSISRDEVKAGEVKDLFDHDNLRMFLGDIRDKTRLTQAFDTCDTIIHAAALKRVTESVYSPGEIIRTNIQGTINVIQAAQAVGASRVLFISSDKAVHATNLYGASKFTAECYSVQANSYTYPRGLRVSCTRYGNVLGSRGSVTEVWKDIPPKEPIPLTDPGMTRFMITKTEAVDFILNALNVMQGGEVFVPVLQAFKMGDLAEAIYPGRPQKLIGLRPGGEKKHERLVSDEEYGRLYWAGQACVILPSFMSWKEGWGDQYDVPVNKEAAWGMFSSNMAARLDVKSLQRIWVWGA